MKVIKDQRGVTPLIIFLLLIILAIIGFAGWKIWDTNKKPATKAPAPSTTTQKKKVTKEADPTTGWTVFDSDAGVFSLKYPSDWVIPTDLDLCNEGLIMIAPDEDSLGKCATEFFGQISISSTAGDLSADNIPGEGYEGLVTEDVTVDSVAGKKYTATAQDQETIFMVGGLPDNTKLVRYVFVTGGRTYVANYIQQPTFIDVLTFFNLIVNNTLEFS